VGKVPAESLRLIARIGASQRRSDPRQRHSFARDQHQDGPDTVDPLWRSERLIVEIDSYAYHSNRATFTADRARDRYLQARGFRTARISDDKLSYEPAAAARSLHALLRRRRRSA
jgi:very-short-patch-repair endonuclease